MGFRVATFNVTNFNAAGHAFIGRDDTRPFTDAQFATKSAEITAQVQALNADLIGFQEVFSEDALRAAVAASPAMAGATVHAPLSRPVPGLTDRRGRPVSDGPHVGIASRLPITPPQMLTHFPQGLNLTIPVGLHAEVEELHLLRMRRYERPVLRAEVTVPGLPGLVVLVAHLKSKRGKVMAGEFTQDPVVEALGALRAQVVRAAEAAALRAQVVIERDTWIDGKRRPVIVLGDLNDDLDAVTTQMVLGRRFFPTNDAGVAARSTYRANSRMTLFSAFEIAPPPAGQSHTYVFDGRASLIDHILMSADFAPVPGRQRAQVTATGAFNAHLDPVAAGLVLPPVAPFDPAAIQADLAEKATRPPKDPLVEEEPDARTRSALEPFDHGFPFADIEVPPAA
jgi:endonuclease/exonuclease/phosphatase family metal-dependent hydrolase